MNFVQEGYFAIKRLKPKPGFPLAPGQRHLGPLIIDSEQNYMVPAAINTYLREYQRDGVRFFWRQYKEGRGGLLGDDMGLVSSGLSFNKLTHTRHRFIGQVAMYPSVRRLLTPSQEKLFKLSPFSLLSWGKMAWRLIIIAAVNTCRTYKTVRRGKNGENCLLLMLHGQPV